MGSAVLLVLSVGSMWFTAVQGVAQSLAVVSRSENAVCFLDLESGQVSDCVETGRFPHELASDPDRQFAYVPAYGGNEITKIDLLGRRAVGTIKLPGHSALHGIWVTDSSVWVTSEEQRALVRVEPSSGAVDKVHGTDGYRSHMVTGIPGSNMLYVANIDSGSVSILDAEKGLRTVLKTGAGTEGIESAPDGLSVWVSNRADNTISVIRTDTNTIVRTMESGGSFPVKLRFRPDGRQVWVANNRSGTITAFDAVGYSMVARIDVGSRPLGLAFSDASDRAYVSRPGASEIVEISTSSPFSILRRFPVPDSPDGLLFLPE